MLEQRKIYVYEVGRPHNDSQRFPKFVRAATRAKVIDLKAIKDRQQCRAEKSSCKREANSIGLGNPDSVRKYKNKVRLFYATHQAVRAINCVCVDRNVCRTC